MKEEKISGNDNDLYKYHDDKAVYIYKDDSFIYNYDTIPNGPSENIYNYDKYPESLYLEKDHLYSRNLTISGFNRNAECNYYFDHSIYNTVPELNNKLYQPHRNFYSEDYYFGNNYFSCDYFGDTFDKKYKSMEMKLVRKGTRRKNRDNIFCEHCNAKETPLWRHLGELNVCNACWLYYKAHGVKRPYDPDKKTVIRKGRAKKKQEGAVRNDVEK
ncbi:hypothetical protein H312_02191 [Anncaliia algerae PRA339]|uniref:GATA-type domain-containing protein n=1 Tax=Anncaliia algerae PRA339 TaxID=1288291 RepID=A0A059EZE3_9MICR|nr:hypothetical protein H312_02191 [Anncaliia algerae PRA339]